MIQIGDNKLATSRAGGFEEKLLETTGFSVAEHAAALAGYQPAAFLSRILHPMLADPMPIGELAAAIDAAGPDSVRHDVLALLTAAPTDGAKVYDPRKKAGDGDN